MQDGMLPHAVPRPRTDDKPDGKGQKAARWQETEVTEVLEKRRDGDMMCCQSKPLRRQCSNRPCSACGCVGVCGCACVLLYVWVGEDVWCCDKRHYPAPHPLPLCGCCAAALPRCRADPPPCCPAGIPAAPLLRCPDAVWPCCHRSHVSAPVRRAHLASPCYAATLPCCPSAALQCCRAVSPAAVLPCCPAAALPRCPANAASLSISALCVRRRPRWQAANRRPKPRSAWPTGQPGDVR